MGKAHDDNKVLQIPKWLSVFLVSVVVAAGSWAYSVGTDISAMRVSLSHCLERFNIQDQRLDRLEDRVHTIETSK